MPVDKTQFVKSVRQIFEKGMTAAITEGLTASVKAESPVYSDNGVTATMEKTIKNMAQKGADAAAKEFIDKVSEDLVDAVDEYIRLIIKNTVATLIIPPNGELKGSTGPVQGTVLIKLGDLKVV
jgi:hypothetical protein